MLDKNLEDFQKALSEMSATESLEWVFNNFELDEISFATSLGAEDQVLTDIILKVNKEADIFTLDTGRLFEETYNVIQKVKEKYSKNIELLFPNEESLKNLTKEKGPNLFYNSIEDRKECCNTRKLEPLRKKLNGKKIWITGLRKEQAVTRTDLKMIEWDSTFGLLKLSPLIDWTEKNVWEYIRRYQIPYNKLHDKGFPSIGCEPCTRAIKPGEDIRSGRWFWEKPEHKECGLHIKNGKLVRESE